MQSVSTRDPIGGGNHFHMCVLRNVVPLKSFSFNNFRHQGREVVIIGLVLIPPQQYFTELLQQYFPQ